MSLHEGHGFSLCCNGLSASRLQPLRYAFPDTSGEVISCQGCVNHRRSERRTSGAKALIGQFFSAAKAVPFVKSLFPICLKPSPTRIRAARLLKACPSSRVFANRESRATFRRLSSGTMERALAGRQNGRWGVLLRLGGVLVPIARASGRVRDRRPQSAGSDRSPACRSGRAGLPGEDQRLH